MPIITYEVKIDVPEFPKDLPESDGIPMETPWHPACMNLLIKVLAHHWRGRTDYFAGGNMFLYYSADQALNKDYRGPDFFVVLGVDGARRRTTWKVWEENGRYPDVIVELLSPSTAEEDRTTKKDLYERTFHTGEYFLYDPEARALEGWRLENSRYRPIQPNSQGQLWCDSLGMWLGKWHGPYLETPATWIRFFSPEGGLIPIRSEAAEQRAADAEQRAATAAQRAEAADQRINALEAKIDRLLAWLTQQGTPPPTNGGSNS